MWLCKPQRFFGRFTSRCFLPAIKLFLKTLPGVAAEPLCAFLCVSGAVPAQEWGWKVAIKRSESDFFSYPLPPLMCGSTNSWGRAVLSLYSADKVSALRCANLCSRCHQKRIIFASCHHFVITVTLQKRYHLSYPDYDQNSIYIYIFCQWSNDRQQKWFLAAKKSLSVGF